MINNEMANNGVSFHPSWNSTIFGWLRTSGLTLVTKEPTYAIVMPNLFGLFVETSHTIVQKNDLNLIKS